MLTIKEKAVALGCVLFIDVVVLLISLPLFVIGLFASVPLAVKILRM